MEVLPELGKRVVVEAAVHGRTFLQITCILSSGVRSVSQRFSPSKSRIVIVVLSRFPLLHCGILSDVHLVQTISSMDDPCGEKWGYLVE